MNMYNMNPIGPPHTSWRPTYCHDLVAHSSNLKDRHSSTFIPDPELHSLIPQLIKDLLPLVRAHQQAQQAASLLAAFC
eukprot:COSAG01_NODE_9115_length_2548_cov_2.696611_3_plen_78_part_00